MFILTGYKYVSVIEREGLNQMLLTHFWLHSKIVDKHNLTCLCCDLSFLLHVQVKDAKMSSSAEFILLF